MNTLKTKTMVLRYSIELKTRPTFTASHKGELLKLQLKKELLKAENKRLGYTKYSHFKYYDDENNLIHNL